MSGQESSAPREKRFILLRPPVFRRVAKWLIWIGAILLFLGILTTAQGFSRCSYPGSCSDQLVFVLTYGGGLTLGAVILFIGPVLLAFGVVMYVVWHQKMRPAAEEPEKAGGTGSA